MSDGDIQVRTRAGVYAVLDWLKHAGVSLDPIERTIDYWRDLGLARAVALTLLVVTPLVKYAWVPWMGSRIVETAADMSGLDLAVGDWSGSWFDLKATGSDLVLKSRGTHTRPQLAEADSVTIDLSFWRWLGGHGWVKEVVVKKPTVYLERTLAGRWNWSDLKNVSAGPVWLTASTLRLDDLRVEWIEHLPGDSGSGVVHSSRAMMYIDGADVLLQDVTLPFSAPNATMKFAMNGRAADGVLSIDGAANVFRLVNGPAAQPPVPRNAALDSQPSVESTAGRATVYLENVGAGLFGQMLARGAIMPTTGTMNGSVEFVVVDNVITCKTNLQLTQVSYAPNPSSVLLRGATDRMRQGLSGVSVTQKVEVGCEGDASKPQYRPLTALQASVTRAAVADAPPIVQQAALVDERYTSGEIGDAELRSMSDDLVRGGINALAARVAGETGAKVMRSLTEPNGQPKQEGNAVSRGVKGFGSGLKRLFGSGK